MAAMKQSYDDIRDIIAKPPIWYDENGVPRYSAYHPSSGPNIYDREAVLFEVECQACQERFEVALSLDPHSGLVSCLADRITHKTLHYEDPPIHHCMGDTMNSVPKKTLQVWRREGIRMEWVRVPELENRDIRPQWSKAGEGG